MASKLGVTALYLTPTQESGGPLTPRPPGSPPLVLICKNLIWLTAAILKIEKVFKYFLELHNDTLHKFGNKTANTLCPKK